MKDTKKYYDYIDKLINDTPDFMLINDDESYVLLDRLKPFLLQFINTLS